MKKRYVVRMMLVLLLGGLLISGCVSLKEYNKLKNQYKRDAEKFEEHTQKLATAKRRADERCNKLTLNYAATDAENQGLRKKMRATDEAMDKLRKDIVRILREGKFPVSFTSRGDIEIQGEVLFNPGRAELKESGKDVLAKVAEVFKQNPDCYIRIEGHTDDDPIKVSPWPTRSNFELAAYRALKVLLYFEELGIDPARMYLSSFGQYRPKSENKTENRRVVIGFEKIMIEEEPGEDEPRK